MRLITLFVIAIIGLLPTFTQAATVSFSMTIIPVRIMIVDASLQIVGDWNNLSAADDEYTLLFRLNELTGPALQASDNLLEQTGQYLRTLERTDQNQTVARTLDRQSNGQWQETVSVISW